MNRGMINELLPLEIGEEQPVGQLVDVESLNNYLMNDLSMNMFRDTTAFHPSNNISFARSVYFPLFNELANQYYLLGENDKSDAVIRRAFELFPNGSIPYNYQSFQLAKVAARNGNTALWRDVVRKSMRNIIDEVNWYVSFEPLHEFITYDQTFSKANQLTVMMNEIKSLDPELNKEFELEMKLMNEKFSKWVNSNELMNKAFSR